MMTTRLQFLLPLLLLALVGCQANRIVLVETETDPGQTLPPLGGTRVLITTGSIPASQTPTLTERRLETAVAEAADQLGFDVTTSLSDADYVLFCGESSYEREYETVRYLPVHESTYGWHGWHDNYHSHHYHTYRSVPVPVSRIEQIGVISILAARRSDVEQFGSDPETVERIAVWAGSVSSQAVPIRTDRRWHARELLKNWGTDAHEVFEVDDRDPSGK